MNSVCVVEAMSLLLSTSSSTKQAHEHVEQEEGQVKRRCTGNREREERSIKYGKAMLPAL